MPGGNGLTFMLMLWCCYFPQITAKSNGLKRFLCFLLALSAFARRTWSLFHIELLITYDAR